MAKGSMTARSGAAVVLGFGATRGRVLRGALLGTTAIVGVTLVAPAAAQVTKNPTGGGSITAPNNQSPTVITDSTASGGGVQITNVDTNPPANPSGITIIGVNYTNTTGAAGGPSADGYYAQPYGAGSTRTLYGDSTNTNPGSQPTITIGTTVAGGAAVELSSGTNLGEQFYANGHFSGTNGFLISAPSGFINFQLNNGVSETVTGTGAVNSTGVNLSAIGGSTVNAAAGALSISNFTTGINAISAGGATVNTSGGGTISATTTGILASVPSGTASVSVTSGEAITVGTGGTGISATSNGGAVSVTTVAGGTIDGGAAGISVSGATGANATTVTVGAAIGSTTAPVTYGVNFQASDGAPLANTLQVNANINSGGYGVFTSASTTTTIAGSTTLNAGSFAYANNGAASMLTNMGTISGGTAVLSNAGSVLVNNLGTINATTGIQLTNGALTLLNSGVINGASGTAITAAAGSPVANISLLAGSQLTGAITLGNADDTLQLYNGQGVQTGGAKAAASFGAIDLGGGTNTLVLRGVGDDRSGNSNGNGAAGTIDTSTVAGLTNLSKQDSGTWLLTGSANYTGTTTISGGTLVESNTGSALGNGGVSIASGATLEFANTAGLLYTKGTTFTGAGTIKFTGNQITAIGYGGNGDTTISLSSGGLIDVEGGIVNGSSSDQGFYTGNLADLYIASGAIFDGVEGAVRVDVVSGGGTLRGGYGTSGSTTIGVDNGSGTFNGVIADGTNPDSPLNLTKTGTGTQGLAGVNTYTGTTTIDGGTLALSGAGSIASSALVTVTFPGTFNLNGVSSGASSIVNLAGDGSVVLGATTLTLTNGVGTFSGAISGAGGLTKQGAGTFILTGNDSYAGVTTVSAGTLQGTTSSIVGSSITDNATLAYNQTASGTVAQNISGTGAVTVSGLTGTNAVTFNGALSNSGGLTAAATGNVTIGATGSVLNNNTVGAIQVTGAGDIVTVASGGQVTSAATSGVNVAAISGAVSYTVANAGTITGPGIDPGSGNGSDGIYAGAGLTLTNSGNIYGIGASSTATTRSNGVFVTGPANVTSTAGTIKGGWTGVFLAGGGSLDNAGTITGNLYAGAELGGGTSNTVVNRTGGVIQGMGSQGSGLLIDGGTWSVTNNAGGSILGGGPGGIYARFASALSVDNSGVVQGNSGSTANGQGYGIYSTNTGTVMVGGSAYTAAITNRAGGDIVGSYAGIETDGIATITNAGTIAAGTYDTGSGAVTVGGSYGIYLGAGGIVSNTGGLIEGGSQAGIYSAGGALGVTNSGTISTAGTGTVDGVTSQGTLTLTNTGSITSAAASGVAFVGTGSSITNSGTITGGANATYGYGIQAAGGAAGTITNQSGGTLTGGLGGIGRLGSGAVTIDNSGMITGTGTTSYGVNVTGGSGTITNRSGGVIAGATDGIVSSVAVSITNAGTINGASGIYINNGQGTVPSVTNQAGGVITATNGIGVYNGQGSISLTNAGIIQQTNTGGSNAVEAHGTLTLANSGTISNAATNNSAAVYVVGNLAATSSNSGLIQSAAGATAFYVTGTTNLANNTGGTIVGTYGLNSSGVATITNAGTIAAGLYTAGPTPSITLGSGNGAYLVAGGSFTNSGAALASANGGQAFYSGGALTLANSGDIAGSLGVVSANAGTGNTLTNTGRIVTGTIAGNAQGGAYTIAATGVDAVRFAGGTITNGAAGNNSALIYGQSDGIFGNGAGQVGVNNYGTIRANNYAAIELTQAGAVENYAGATITGGNRNNSATDTGTGIRLDAGGTVINDAGASINATAAATNIGVLSTSGAFAVINSGSISGAAFAIRDTGTNGASIGLLSGSTTTGAIQTGSNGDSLTLYTGRGTGNGGTLAAASFGAINLGGGTNAVILRGAGADAAVGGATGQQGTLDLSTLQGASRISKYEGGSWVLTGAANTTTTGGTPATSAATIYAGSGAQNTTGVGGEGIVSFNGTTGLTGTIYVNGAVVQVSGNGALGTGVIHMVDPNITFTSTSTQTNDIVLDVASPASNPSPGSNTTTDPSTFQANAGVVGTLSGAITTGTGNNQNGKAIDANQPVVIAGAGTIALTNAGNAWTGVTTINAGATLRGTTASLSGASFTDNGVLDFDQTAAGSSARAIAGSGVVQVTSGGAATGGNVSLTGAITATGGVQVGAGGVATLSNASGASGSEVTFTGAGATLNVASGGTVSATNGNAVSSIQANNTVNNAGILAGNANYTAVYLNGAGGADTIVNTGTISGYNAIYDGPGSTLALTNSGTLTGSGLSAVAAYGTVNVANSGTIAATTRGYAIYANVGGTIANLAGGSIAGQEGIYTGGMATIGNHGTITSRGAGDGIDAGGGGTITNYADGAINANGDPQAYGIDTFGTAATVTNAGAITAGSGLVTQVTGTSFTNSGTITAMTNGVWGSGTSVNLVNSGAINAGVTGVRAEAAGSSIVNSGTIAGSAAGAVGVYMTGGTLTSQAGGVISAGQANGAYGTAIQLAGTGNTLNLLAGSTVNGSIDASATTDGSNSYTFTGTLNGGFTGGSGNDTVTLVTPVTMAGTLDGGAGIDTLVLDGAGTGSLNSAQVVNFENGVKQGSGTWTLTGTTAASPSAWAVNAGTLAVAGGNAIGDTASVTVASGATFALAANDTIDTLAGAGGVTLGANTLTVGGGNGGATFSGVIAGSGGLTKVGTGVETLSGANTYTGATTVVAGTLALGATNAIAAGSGLSVASGATFNLAGYNDTVASLALSGTLAGTGTLTAATYTLNGATVNANLGTGTLAQIGGTSVLNGTANTGTINVQSGTLALGASNRIVDSANVTVGTGATLNMGAFSDTVGGLTLAGTLAGTGTLTAATYTLNGATVNANLGAGTLTQAAGTSTLSGTAAATTVNVTGGTLALGASDRLADTAAVTISSGATLNLGAFTDAVGTLNLAGTLAGTGTLTAATYTLNAGTVNANLGTGTLYQMAGTSVLAGTTNTAAVNVAGGTLALGASDRIVDTAAVVVATGATLNLGAYSDTVGTLTIGGTLAGTGTLTAASYTLVGASVNANLGAGTLAQMGGTSVLTGTTSTASVNVAGGTLRLGASDRIVDASVVTIANGATFDLAGYNETVGTLTGAGAVTLGAGTLTTGGNNTDATYAGVVSGPGNLTKVGTGALTLTGANTLTGLASVNAGTLVLLGSTAGAVRVAGGTLAGTGQIAGNLAVSSGTLSVGTAAQPVGTLAAGSLTVSGGTTVFDFAGSAGGFGADRINVAGNATLTGGLVSARATEPTADYRVMQTYTLIQAAGVTGTFANGTAFTQSANNADLYYRLRYDLVPGSVLLEVRKQIDFNAGLAAAGASGNQLAVGAALNGSALTASDAYAKLLNTIQPLDAGGKLATYNSISGEGIADLSTSVGLMNQRFTDLLRRRLASGGTGAAAGGADLIAAAANGSRGLANARAVGALDGASQAFADTSGDGQGVHGGGWVQSFGGYGLLRGQPGSANLYDQSYGIAGGLEGRLGNLTAGIAGAGAGIDTRVTGRASKGNGTIYQAAGYAAYDNGRLYGNLIGTYFSGDVTSTRSVFVGTTQYGVATGRANAHGFGGSAVAGYRFDLGSSGWRYTPQLGFEATHVHRDAFTETGAGLLDLAAGSQRRTLYRADAEGRLSHVFTLGNGGGTVEPYVGGGFEANWGNRAALETMQITGAPAGTGGFAIDGANLAKYTGLITGGIDAHPGERVTLGVGLQTHRSPRQKDGAVQIHAKIAF